MRSICRDYNVLPAPDAVLREPFDAHLTRQDQSNLSVKELIAGSRIGKIQAWQGWGSGDRCGRGKAGRRMGLTGYGTGP